jgi:hypothetical protein
MNEKKCAKCGVIKTVDNFAKKISGKYGVRTKCKECINKEWNENKLLCLTQKRSAEQNRKYYLSRMDKETTENKEVRIADGKKRRLLNKERYNLNRNQARKERIEKARECQRNYYYKNNEKEKYKQSIYREKHAEQERERAKAWRKEHPGECTEQSITKHCRKINRTPAWADIEKIREIYKERTKLTKETGIIHHVDHIIPLKGKTVSGLHVHYNLRIITASENIRKHNKLLEDLCH